MVLHDKLNTFFATVNSIPTLRGAVDFPPLQVGVGMGVCACVSPSLTCDAAPPCLYVRVRQRQ